MSALCPVCQRPLPEDSNLCGHCACTIDSSASAEAQPLDLSTPMFDSDPDVHGIGGWLILVLIGLIVSPFVLLHAIWLDLRPLTGTNLALIGIRLPGLPALITFELFANLVLFAGLIVLLVFFFRESRRFPRLFQLWLGLSLAARLAEYTLSLQIGTHSDWEGASQLMSNMHAKLAVNALQGLIAAILWISYFQVSRRVKATFVR